MLSKRAPLFVLLRYLAHSSDASLEVRGFFVVVVVVEVVDVVVVVDIVIVVVFFLVIFIARYLVV